MDEQGPNEQEQADLCMLLKTELPRFYDKIFIPFKLFKKNNFDISKVLNENEDILFYSDIYLTEEDNERFYTVYNKYIDLLDPIFDPENNLYKFLKKWKGNKKSYLFKLITGEKYNFISPHYIIELYLKLKQKYNSDYEKLVETLEKKLDNIIIKFEEESKEFRKVFKSIINAYVYEHPIGTWNGGDEIFGTDYLFGFVNSVCLAILDYSEKLIDINIIYLNYIITDIVDIYLPMNYIVQYDPSDHKNKKLLII